MYSYNLARLSETIQVESEKFLLQYNSRMNQSNQATVDDLLGQFFKKNQFEKESEKMLRLVEDQIVRPYS